MIFTILNYFIAWFQGAKEHQRKMQYVKLLRNNIGKQSLIIGKKKFLQKDSQVGSRLSALLNSGHQQLKENIFLQENDTVFASVASNVSC